MTATDYQGSANRAKATFFLGLAVLLSLVYYSALSRQQIAWPELAALLAVTLAALIYDYVKVGQFLTTLGRQEAVQASHELAIQRALTATLKWPLLKKLFETELLTLYYAFFAKHREPHVRPNDNVFDYSAASNAHDVFLFVALSQLPFLPFVHIVIEQHKGPGPAWIITALTLWSVIWYLAQVEAARHRPIELGRTEVKYRFGLMWAADIPLTTIRSARRIEVDEELDGAGMFLSPLGSKKNVMLEFGSPIQFKGPYGLHKRRQRAAISVDDPAYFLRQLALNGVATH